MNDDELVRIYEAHIANGASEEEAQRAVDLAAAGGETSPELEQQKRLSAGGGSGVGDFGRLLAQGASLGFGDEITGMLYGKKAGEKSRQRVADLHTAHPVLSSLIEGAGSALVPVSSGGAVVRGGGGLIKGAARGAITGGLTGFAQGVGEGTGSAEERARGAGGSTLTGAVFGGVAGVLPALANAFGKSAATRGTRVVGAVREASGIEKGLAEAATEAEGAKNAARAMYPVSTQVITDPNILAVLDPADLHMAKAMRAVAPEGFQAGGPTIDELQTIRQELRDAATRNAKRPRNALARAYREKAQELTKAMNDNIPGFREADRAFAKASGFEEGLAVSERRGANRPRLAKRTAEEGKVALSGEYPEAQSGMRTRMAADVEANMKKGGEWTGGLVERNPEFVARIRNLFPETPEGEQSFKALLGELAKEQSAAKTRKALPWLAGGAALTLGGGKLTHLLNAP